MKIRVEGIKTMNNSVIQALLFLFMSSFGMTLFSAQSRPFQPFLQEMSSLAKVLHGRSDEMTQLAGQVKIAVENLDKLITTYGSTVEHASIDQLFMIKKRVEDAMNRAHMRSESMSFTVEDALKREPYEFSYQVGKKIVDIIERAEQVLLALRKRKTQDVLNLKPTVSVLTSQAQTTFPLAPVASGGLTGIVEAQQPVFQERMIPERKVSPVAHKEVVRNDVLGRPLRVPVTHEWKNTIASEFYKNISYLKSIIVKGESAQEARDFEKRFTEQSQWFDLTLRSTRFQHDTSYSSIVQKCMTLQDLVTAQKRAEAFLTEYVSSSGLSDNDREKMRVHLLYGLYTMLPQGASSRGEPWMGMGLTEQKIREEVLRLLHTLQPSLGLDGKMTKKETVVATAPVTDGAKVAKNDVKKEELKAVETVAPRQEQVTAAVVREDNFDQIDKNPLDQARDIMQENVQCLEDVKLAIQDRELLANEFLRRAAQEQEFERTNLLLKLKNNESMLDEIRSTQQHLILGKTYDFGIKPLSLGLPLEAAVQSVFVAQAPVAKDRCLIVGEPSEEEKKYKQDAELKKSRYETQAALQRVQQELAAKKNLELRIEQLDKKNADLTVQLKQAESLLGEQKEHAMRELEIKTQEIREELTALMELKLREKDLELAQIPKNALAKLTAEQERKMNILINEKQIAEAALHIARQEAALFKKQVTDGKNALAIQHQQQQESDAKSTLQVNATQKALTESLRKVAHLEADGALTKQQVTETQKALAESLHRGTLLEAEVAEAAQFKQQAVDAQHKLAVQHQQQQEAGEKATLQVNAAQKGLAESLHKVSHLEAKVALVNHEIKELQGLVQDKDNELAQERLVAQEATEKVSLVEDSAEKAQQELAKKLAEESTMVTQLLARQRQVLDQEKESLLATQSHLMTPAVQ